jgi:hypothetical protein
MLIIKALTLLLLSGNALSENPEVVTSKIYSYDSSYFVVVKGLTYKGYYCNKQQITLWNKQNHKLWQTEEYIWIAPVVSNLGDVAIILNNFDFYDKNKEMIGFFPRVESNERYWLIKGLMENYPVCAYSYNGQNFYTIMTDGNDNQLVSISRNGFEEWRVYLPNDSIDTYGIYVYDGGSLINCTHKSTRRDSWVLVNDTGKVIASYELSRSNLWLPKINNLKKELSIVEGDSVMIFNLNSGLLIKTISQETKFKHLKK